MSLYIHSLTPLISSLWQELADDVSELLDQFASDQDRHDLREELGELGVPSATVDKIFASLEVLRSRADAALSSARENVAADAAARRIARFIRYAAMRVSGQQAGGGDATVQRLFGLNADANKLSLEQLLVSLRLARHYDAVASDLADEVSELVESLQDDEAQLVEDLESVGLNKFDRDKLLGALRELS